MSETRKIAAILVSDIVDCSRLAGADEDRILARLRALRSDLIDPTIALHHGRRRRQSNSIRRRVARPARSQATIYAARARHSVNAIERLCL